MNVIDLHIGTRIRQRRSELGLTQHAIANALQVSRLEIADFEAGHKRISAAQLFCISAILEVDPAYFFQDLVQTAESTSSAAFDVHDIAAHGPRRPTDDNAGFLDKFEQILRLGSKSVH